MTNPAASSYGFSVSTYGLGDSTWNMGSRPIETLGYAVTPPIVIIKQAYPRLHRQPWGDAARDHPTHVVEVAKLALRRRTKHKDK